MVQKSLFHISQHSSKAVFVQSLGHLVVSCRSLSMAALLKTSVHRSIQLSAEVQMDQVFPFP